MNIDPIFAAWLALVAVLFAAYVRIDIGGRAK